MAANQRSFAEGGELRADGRIAHDMYLMRIKKPEESKSKWDLYDYLETILVDQAFRPISETECPYLKK
jgi:branched-chain amino acid transport system substrate-binding protein